ncbi:MAG: hypothetical protein JNL57_00485 [Bacteroidetes bacterium]|nr:hypothetical protein [Bacteroidota bacterium]
MKQIFALCLFLTALKASSQSPPQHTGVYGFCPSPVYQNTRQIKLWLNPDNTFQYRDDNAGGEKKFISGTWENKGKYVLLRSSSGIRGFHHRWSFSHGHTCLKSRHVLNFRRICRLSGPDSKAF